MKKLSNEDWVIILFVVAFIAFVFYRPGQMALNSFASKTSARDGVGNIWDKEIRSNYDGTYDISYRYDLCVPNGGCFGSSSVYEINVPGNYTGIFIGIVALITALVMKYMEQINRRILINKFYKKTRKSTIDSPTPNASNVIFQRTKPILQPGKVLKDDVRGSSNVIITHSVKSNGNSKYNIGSKVLHVKYGYGRVLNIDGTILQIRFDNNNEMRVRADVKKVWVV